jgi:hypothetical protein
MIGNARPPLAARVFVLIAATRVAIEVLSEGANSTPESNKIRAFGAFLITSQRGKPLLNVLVDPPQFGLFAISAIFLLIN